VNQPVPPRHLLIGLAVVAVWGTNFTVIKVALDDFPPLVFAALRFTFAFVPAAFLIPRPKVAWRLLAAYGLFIGAGQFGILYIAMKSDISPGMASLVIQTQVFFTIALSMALTGERIRPYQVAGLALAVAGIVLIATNTGGNTTIKGLLLTLIAAFSWGCGNIVSRRAGSANMLGFVVWASLFAIVPLWALAFTVEGWSHVQDGFAAADGWTWLAVAYQSAGNTLFGYGAWSWLLSRHPATTITPLALLVPIFGMASASIFLDEALPAWKLAAAGLVIAGLAVNVVVPRVRGRSSVSLPASAEA
jgi:O-acetylserine/cysteine efflux transporter